MLVVFPIFVAGILVTSLFHRRALRLLSPTQGEWFDYSNQRVRELWLPALVILRVVLGVLPVHDVSSKHMIADFLFVALLVGSIVASTRAVHRERRLGFPSRYLRRETYCLVAYNCLMVGFFGYMIFFPPTPSW